MPIVTVNMTVKLPDELLLPFLQAVRDFEHKPKHYDDVVVAMMLDAPHKTPEEVEAVFSAVRPPYPRIERHGKDVSEIVHTMLSALPVKEQS